MNPTIEGITLNTLRNAEYLQLCNQVKTIVLSYGPDGLKVKAQYDAFEAKMTQLDQHWALQQASLQTAPLEQADLRRDKAISGIGIYLDGLLNHFDTGFAESARALREDMAKYGANIARQSYNAQTAIINNLVDDWKTVPILKDAVSKLNMGNWLAELEAANTAFNDIYLLRNKEVLTNPDEKLKELRTEANELYYKLRDKLLAHGLVNDFADPYDKVIKEWNNLVASYNQTIAMRGSRKPDEEVQPA